MYRMANFFISKNLDKAEKMPNYRQWKVSETDRCAEGPVLLYIRAKGWFFDRVSQPAMRYCVLTKRGFLLIYMRNEKGFVLDMRRAYEIKSISDNVSVHKAQYRRCRIKVRYNFGTVNLILTNGKIDLWRDNLLNATNAPMTAAIPRHLTLPPLDADYDVASTPASSPAYGSALENVQVSPSLVALKSFPTDSVKEGSKKENWAKVKSPARSSSSEASVSTALDFSMSDYDDQCLSARLPEVDEEEQSVSEIAETSMSGLFHYDSVRESKVPVGWLRRQLENKIVSDRRRRAPPASTTEQASTVTSSEAPVMAKAVELPQMPLNATTKTLPDQTTVTKAPKAKKQVKFQFLKSRKSPVKATAKSVPSDSSTCENTRFNSFQFWRASIFESDA